MKKLSGQKNHPVVFVAILQLAHPAQTGSGVACLRLRFIISFSPGFP